jgi:hypothetical protein
MLTSIRNHDGLSELCNFGTRLAFIRDHDDLSKKKWSMVGEARLVWSGLGNSREMANRVETEGLSSFPRIVVSRRLTFSFFARHRGTIIRRAIVHFEHDQENEYNEEKPRDIGRLEDQIVKEPFRRMLSDTFAR